MIDKDLDNVLTNLGGETHKDKARDDAMGARNHDADGAADVSGAGSFSGRMRRFVMTEGILLYRGGVIQAIQNHRDFCSTFRMTSVDKEGEPGVEDIIRQYKYTYIRSIENIEKLYEDYARVLDPLTIEKVVKKDFNLYFPGFEEKNKVRFLALTEMYIELREFNSLARKEWRELSESIGVINLQSSGKRLYQALNSVIEAALRFCHATDEFLNYIGHILAIPEDHFDLLKSEIHAKTSYHEDFSYDYDELFELGRNDDARDRAKSELPGAEDMLAGGRSATAEPPSRREQKPAASTLVAMEISESAACTGEPETAVFTIRGTRSWNTREPYLIKLNRERVLKDMEDLSESFYFLQNPMDEKVLEGEIKRSMLRFMRDKGSIYNSYCEFVLKSVFSKINEITEFFGAGDMISLFVYHIGPLPVYMVTVDSFNASGTGCCFKYGAGKRVSRFMPQEFIKQKVLEWFENNVNVFDLPFDNIQEYENIRKMVSKKYYAAVDENNRKLDMLIEEKNLRADPKFDRNEFYRTLHKAWFGAANITVYNRFMEKTIFK